MKGKNLIQTSYFLLFLASTRLPLYYGHLRIRSGGAESVRTVEVIKHSSLFFYAFVSLLDYVSLYHCCTLAVRNGNTKREEGLAYLRACNRRI